VAALSVERVRLRLRLPLRTAWGELRERELLKVTLAFSDSDWGEGEAAPLEPYDGVPLPAVVAALDAYGSIVAEADPDAPAEELMAACRAERPLPQALAALDLALWDRAGRRAGKPVAALLADKPAASVRVNATVGAEDRAGAAAAAAEAAAAGYGCVKVKVGVGDDAGRLAAVRAALGPDVALRVDANGAWRTPDEALANLRALAPAVLELCEEPVHGVEPLRAVRAESPVPVAMDETAAEPGAAGSGAADAVCLKIARCGGITALLREAEAARAAGSSVYLSSTYDGPLGIAAGLHAAATLAATGPILHCGLATLRAFASIDPGPLTPHAGAITLPPGPGLLGGERRSLAE
jgi:L-Ala-D/L-Glu epimerase